MFLADPNFASPPASKLASVFQTLSPGIIRNYTICKKSWQQKKTPGYKISEVLCALPVLLHLSTCLSRQISYFLYISQQSRQPK